MYIEYFVKQSAPLCHLGLILTHAYVTAELTLIPVVLTIRLHVAHLYNNLNKTEPR